MKRRGKMDVTQINNMCANTLVSHLGIEFTEVGDGYLKATMPVDDRTRQPQGLLHGGASAALAETLGSVGSALRLDLSRQVPVGLEINANHIRAITGGTVTGTATALHLGRRTHVWDIKIEDETGRLICTSRLTIMVVDR
ncbi:MAG: hotdog fold thioesterase [Chloroflexi bacterium]|nr:MAG: hotdog fold thioesterase [Chloroflexota bacterium]